MNRKQPKLLLIEDNLDDIRLLKEYLSEVAPQFDLVHADRLSNGLNRLAEDEIDVVLLDLGLPDSRGFGTFAKIHAQVPKVPIVVLTDLDDEDLAVAVKAVREGAQNYLVKQQVNGELLRCAIQHAIERRRAEDAEETLQQARLLAETREALAREQRLTDIALTISSTLDLSTILTNVVRLAAELVGAEAGALALVEPDGETIVYPYLFNLPEELSLQPSPESQGLAWHIVETGESVLVPEYGEHPSALPHWVEAGVRGFIGVPIVSGGRNIGALGLFTLKAEQYFVKRDVALAESVGRQAGVAIQNARLFEETERRARQMTLMGHIAHQAVASLDPDALLWEAARAVQSAFDYPDVLIFLVDHERQQIIRKAWAGWYERDTNVERTRSIQDRGILDWVATHGETVLANDVRRDPRYVPFYRRTAAELCVPLKVDDTVLGGVNVESEERDAFDQSDVLALEALADNLVVALRNARLYQETEQRLQRLTALREIDQAITTSLDVHVTLNVILEQVISQLEVHAADVLLLDPPSQTLKHTAGRGFHTNALQYTRLQLGEGHAGRAALERRVVSIPQLAAAKNGLRRSPLLSKEGFVAYYGVPLMAKGQVKGVLEIFHREPIDADPEWLDFLEALATQAAIAIDNAQLFDGLQRSNTELRLAYDTTLEGWACALEMRDAETEDHTRRVTEMTLRLARAVSMNGDELVHVRRGAVLHDIGKIAIPDRILLKPGPLDDDEWKIMHQHPVYAYDLLSPIAFLRPALDIPYCHHEKWDGTGYPRSLQGEQIPRAARIFAVVDVWDALRSDRPYRNAWSDEKALEYIRRESGQHFDPEVVEVFLDILEGFENI